MSYLVEPPHLTLKCKVRERAARKSEACSFKDPIAAEISKARWNKHPKEQHGEDWHNYCK